MTLSAAEWDGLNAEYLNAATAWVRAKLERQAAAVAAARPARPRRRRRRGLCDWLRGERHRVEAPPRPTVEAGAGEAAAAARMAAACRTLEGKKAPPPRPVNVQRRFELSDPELNALLLCTAVELDTAVRWLCAAAQDDPNRPYVTFGLARVLFGKLPWDALTPEGPLRRARLIEVTQPAATPLIAAAVSLDEWVLHYFMRPQDSPRMDDRLASVSSVVWTGLADRPLPASQEVIAEGIARLWEGGTKGERTPAAVLVGPDPASKLLVAERAARLTEKRMLLRLPAEQLPAAPADLELLARVWEREIGLYHRALYLDADDDLGLAGGDGPGAARSVALNRFLAITPGVVFVAARDLGHRLVRPHAVFDVARPTAAEQEVLWAKALAGPPNPPTAAERQELSRELAGECNLGVQAIREAAARARARPDGGLRPRLREECQAITRPRLDGLAQRISTSAALTDLVLPGPTNEQLQALIDQVRNRRRVYEEWGFADRLNRGLGVSAMFAGPTGTGKTTAAEAVAAALELPLYRVDLSAVVSKYIGETERNLRRVFDAFEDGGAVMLVDEADALFARRTEVKDSLDLHANRETSYLLQRLEAYRGLAILATNNRGAVDTAFLRRLRFVIEFPQPEPDQRQQIWRKLLPEAGARGQPPTEGLDYSHLAKWDLSGGSILTAALNASFRAAARGERAKVTMADVLPAVEAELRKYNRAVRPGDLYTPRWRPVPAAPAAPANGTYAAG
jgi:hypothetical protein